MPDGVDSRDMLLLSCMYAVCQIGGFGGGLEISQSQLIMAGEMITSWPHL